jgi:hypothetical protein
MRSAVSLHRIVVLPINKYFNAVEAGEHEQYAAFGRAMQLKSRGKRRTQVLVGRKPISATKPGPSKMLKEKPGMPTFVGSIKAPHDQLALARAQARTRPSIPSSVQSTIITSTSAVRAFSRPSTL